MFEGRPNQEEIFQELATIRIKRYTEAPEETHEKVVVFDERLRADLPNTVINDSRLYHMLIGSTAHDTKTFDVPGGLIERFIREEL